MCAVNRRGDAGFGRRSAIIGKLKKNRLIHTVTHLACKGLNIRKGKSAVPDGPWFTKSGALAHEDAARARLSYGLLFLTQQRK